MKVFFGSNFSVLEKLKHEKLIDYIAMDVKGPKYLYPKITGKNFVCLIDDVEMEELHIKWMELPGATDVMSFPMDELRPNDPEPGILGDIVISPLFARAQAEKAGHSFEHEVYILAAHGLLHLLGYDHQELDEEKVMFALQEDLVKKAAL